MIWRAEKPLLKKFLTSIIGLFTEVALETKELTQIIDDTFSDQELDILYNYYQRLTESSEFKLISWLLISLAKVWIAGAIVDWFRTFDVKKIVGLLKSIAYDKAVVECNKTNFEFFTSSAVFPKEQSIPFSRL